MQLLKKTESRCDLCGIWGVKLWYQHRYDYHGFDETLTTCNACIGNHGLSWTRAKPLYERDLSFLEGQKARKEWLNLSDKPTDLQLLALEASQFGPYIFGQILYRAEFMRNSTDMFYREYRVVKQTRCGAWFVPHLHHFIRNGGKMRWASASPRWCSHTREEAKEQLLIRAYKRIEHCENRVEQAQFQLKTAQERVECLLSETSRSSSKTSTTIDSSSSKKTLKEMPTSPSIPVGRALRTLTV